MDKQIIVDGCNVTGCDHFSVYSGNGCRCYFLENEDDIVGCENYPNCYYKQLKRTESELACKEQECEELKNELIDIKWNIEAQDIALNDNIEQLDQLKAKNDELKKVNNHIENNRKQKADKLMRIEKLIIACSTGYTDEFIQELLVILHEPEPIKE